MNLEVECQQSKCPFHHTICLPVARTIARRVERNAINLRELEGSDAVRPTVIAYLNRLSDWLFVLARWTVVIMGEEEVLWVPFSKRETD